MPDNTEIKDGLGNEFTLRTKDISPLQDASLRRAMTFATLYPVDYGAGGSYAVTLKSGTMAAGLAATSPILSFRWTSSTLLALVKRIRISAWSMGTGFAAGVGTIELYKATGFSAADTGGGAATMTGGEGKLRTTMGTSSVGEIRLSATATLTAGTRTLATNPIESLSVGIGTTTYTSLLTEQKLFEKLQGEHPLVLAQYEGFVIQATVPATGTWSFAISPEWDEVPLF